jgi:hypothetical protein
MGDEHPIDRQVRLILEQQCASAARQLAARLTGGEHLILFFFDFGSDTAPGNGAFFTDDGAEGPIAAIRGWLEAGCRVVPIEVATPEEGEELTRKAHQIAEWIGGAAPAGVGYALLVWVDSRNMFYASNARRPDIARMYDEWLAAGRWPKPGSGS